jgi:hypothetical protein
MATSKAATVQEYLAELPEERRTVISTIRDLIVQNVPAGYQEMMNYGMISYAIPLERYPKTYNKQPLTYISLAAQKNYYTIYLMGAYADSEQEQWLRAEFAKRNKKFDMGKSCLRFRALDDLPLEVVGEAIASISPEAFIAIYEASRKK